MNVVIIGAGGHAKVVIDIVISISKINKMSKPLISLLDDNLKAGTMINSCKVIGKISDCYRCVENNEFIIGIGNNATRKKIAEEYNVPYRSAIHPNAVIGSGVKIGNGTVVMAGSVINCESIIGRHCIINTGSTIDHENRIADFVHVSPGAHTGGDVKIGKESWLGIGSCMKNGITIGDNCVIGAGAVVLDEISSNSTVVGNPAKILNYQRKKE